MIRIDTQQRRSRLACRHHLAPGAQVADVAVAARDLVGLHATDAATVFLAANARMTTATTDDVEHELYQTRRVVRMLGMRRTIFVVPAELAPIVQAACTRAIEAVTSRKTAQLLEQAGVAGDGHSWLKQVQQDTLEALVVRGEATAVQLSQDVPDLKRQLRFGEGTKWVGQQGVSTRVLFLLAAQGRIVRGRPLGSWISTQYRWAPMDTWLPGGMPELPAETARVELARRWLRAFGPATAADVKWWTGWTMGQVRQALAAVAAVEVSFEGGTGLVLDDDVAPVAPPAPWAALLPALDPTTMGWAGRSWYLGRLGPMLFDRSGNAGPTVWWDGRIVGGWAQRKDGEIALRLLEDVGADAVAAIEDSADRLRTWLGEVRVTPRFRTPLERALTG